MDNMVQHLPLPIEWESARAKNATTNMVRIEQKK